MRGKSFASLMIAALVLSSISSLANRKITPREVALSSNTSTTRVLLPVNPHSTPASGRKLQVKHV
jgi:hypothetical protein